LSIVVEGSIFGVGGNATVMVEARGEIDRQEYQIIHNTIIRAGKLVGEAAVDFENTSREDIAFESDFSYDVYGISLLLFITYVRLILIYSLSC
jgi:hypothetical protein